MTESNVDEGVQPYNTLAGPAETEIVVERSRFIAHALPVRSVSAAEELVAALKKEHYDARHVCYGLRVGRGAQGVDRSNDDGEPARTGGFPLWQILEGGDITDAVVAVVRYFGGTKLGTGGLARAYRGAGRAAIETAGVIERWPELQTTLTVPYAMLDQTNYLLAQLDEVRVENVEYAGEPTLRLAVRKVCIDDVRSRLGGLLGRDPTLLLPRAAET